MSTTIQLPPPNTPPPSWLNMIGDGRVQMPDIIKKGAERLRAELKSCLLQDDREVLETGLTQLLPEVYALRLKVIPLLARIDLGKAVIETNIELAMVSQKQPKLISTMERLNFGLQLSAQFVNQLAGAKIDLNVNNDAVQQVLKLDYHTFIAILEQVPQENQPQVQQFLNLLNGSLGVEILLFTVDLIADENLVLDESIYDELRYQASVAVKTYAAGFGQTPEQMPWYLPPQNKLQQILLDGPIFAEAEIEYIKTKQGHLNAWK